MIWKLVEKIEAKATQWYHQIHNNPELSGEEVETAKYITKLLRSWGISVRTGVAGNGVVGIIEGKEVNGKVIGLRADMDALPIDEKTNLPYKSKKPGIMHACGHDVHVANLLASAYILNEIREKWNGRVVLIFQPSEETLPGGALKMIEANVLDDPYVDVVIGMHVSPELSTGTIGYKSGVFMSSTDEIYIEVKGKSGHAALVKEFIDPVVSSAAIIINLQQIISRRNNPIIPTVLSIGKVIANGRTNVIPSLVNMEGTFRTFDENWRNEAKTLINEIVYNTAQAYATTANVNILSGYPTLYNDEKLSAEIINFIKNNLSEIKLIEVPMRMTSDDFAYFALQRPSFFFRLGTGNEKKGTTYQLHTDKFRIDDEALKYGIYTMSSIAFGFLNNQINI
ncbi:MAG: M20 family metallopeptidase [Bacteroidales bacterium]|jgi:amidohydrolase